MSELVIQQGGVPVAGATCQLFHATVTIPPRDPASMVAGEIDGRPVMFVDLAAPFEPTPPAVRGAEILERDHRVMLGESLTLRATTEQPFVPAALLISDDGTSGGAGDWVVNDIRIDGTGWFIEMGDVPGDIFTQMGATMVGSFLREIESGREVEIDVTYIGMEKTGAPFRAALITAPVTPAPEAA